MKAERVQSCIDYIRFDRESGGCPLSETEEPVIRAILLGEETPDDAIQAFIDDHHLDSEYLPPANEGGVYPATTCLVNFFSIKDRPRLRKVAGYLSSIRSAEMLRESYRNTYDLEYLKVLHGRLFGDVFPSAGQIRTTVAAKRTVFCNPAFIESAARDVFTRLRKEQYLKHLDREHFIDDLAFQMGEVEALHPFRNGNGSAIRLFFFQLIGNAGHDLDWSRVDPDRWLEADINAIEGDCQQLIGILEEVVL